MKISILIPVYNSEKTIGPLCEELLESVGKKYQLEIILVNDGSKDQSWEKCADLCRAHPALVRAFSLSKNMGEHNAVMAGLNQTTGDYVVIMDDDFQNSTMGVESLIQGITDQKKEVVYSRYPKKQHNFFRNLGSWFNGRVANLLLDKPKDLYLSSFKIISRFVVDEIIKYDLPFPYIDGLILRLTSDIGTVEVVHEQRTEGKSGYTIPKLIGLWLNTFTNFSILPLRAAVFLGTIFSLMGFVLAFYVLWEKFHNPALPIGWPSLFVAISIFSGIQLIALGVIGEYLGRTFLFMTKSPQYVVKKKLP